MFRMSILSASIACAIAAWTVAPSAAPATVRIRLATAAPKDTSYHHILLEMRDKWRAATAGRVELTVYPGGTQGSEADVVRRMNVGELQAALLTAGGISEVDPAASALEEIPMLFR